MNAFITGTNSGIGLALTREYLENGASVYGISRKYNPKLKSYADYHHLSHDLSDLANLKGGLERLLNGVGELDQVVLNAGMLPEIKDMRESSLDEIKHVMNVNVWSNKLLIDILFDVTGKVHQVVAISSGASISGSRGWNAYSLSKATLNMMIKLYAKELPETHFSAISPGIVETGMQDFIWSLPDDPRFTAMQRLKEKRASGRMSSPRDSALLLIEVMGSALQKESGAYLDVRDYEDNIPKPSETRIRDG